ncbi:hypothetical protein GF362_04985 [Candidatus Dojkabacteria bacterium]|nr:hypothetical protein [Candidatus Dojkabacteria bacterium]
MINNIKDFKELEQFEKQITEIEDRLFPKIPFAFTRFLTPGPELVDKIIEKYSSYLNQRLDFEDKKITNLITKYNNLCNDVFKKFNIPPNVHINYMSSVERNLLFSMYIAQYARLMLIKPSLAKYQLEKILSKSERELFGVSRLQIEDIPTALFELFDFLKTDELGNFDTEKTIREENSTNNIKTFLSTIQSLGIQTKTLYSSFKNQSKHIPFSYIHKDIVLDICEAASQTIIEIYIRELYKLISENVKFPNASYTIKKKLQKTALEYLNKGNTENDEYQIGKQIYENVQIHLNAFDEIKKFKEDFIQSLTQETLRLSLNLLINWRSMPKNLYYIKLREVNINEQISPEITHAIDVFRIDDENNLIDDLYETYVISFPFDIKMLMYSTAEKGYKIPNEIKDMINVYQEPSAIKRMIKKIGI